MDQQTYQNFLNGIGWESSNYQDIAKCLMEKGTKEMYHAIVHQDDIQHLFIIPNLKIFWCCRCHLVARDGSTAHEHLHALVQYQIGTHQAYKKRMQRSKIRFASKTTFKPILCPDHAVGVLRYICCEDGQTKNKRRDADGLTCKPHTHYSRSVYETHLLHSRNAKQIGGCRYIRTEITENLWKHLSDEWLNKNVSGDGEYALHHHEDCFCENGEKGKQKKKAANKKRKEFYETEKGMDIKKKYSEKAKQKNKLIEELRRMKNCKTQAELSKETIAKLLNML